MVEFFIQRPHLSADLTYLLEKIDDTSRLLQKFLVGRGSPSDLIAISGTIRTWTKILAILDAEQRMDVEEQKVHNPRDWLSINALVSRMHALTELSQTIDSALGIEEGEENVVNGDQLLYNADGEPEDLSECTHSLNLKFPNNNKWFIKPE